MRGTALLTLHVQIAHGRELLSAGRVQNVQHNLRAVHLHGLAVAVLNGGIIPVQTVSQKPLQSNTDAHLVMKTPWTNCTVNALLPTAPVPMMQICHCGVSRELSHQKRRGLRCATHLDLHGHGVGGKDGTVQSERSCGGAARG